MKVIELQAKIENLNKMIEFILSAFSELTTDKMSRNKINLACEEALVNVINYAYESKDGIVRIECESIKEKSTFVIKIINSGIQYNPLTREDPDITIPIENRKIGGLGVYMYKIIMDEVKYEYINNQNILTFVKAFPKKE